MRKMLRNIGIEERALEIVSCSTLSKSYKMENRLYVCIYLLIQYTFI